MASDLPFYDMFVPQKLPLSKTFDNVIACDLWSPPQSKTLATPMRSTAIIRVQQQEKLNSVMCCSSKLVYTVNDVLYTRITVKTS